MYLHIGIGSIVVSMESYVDRAQAEKNRIEREVRYSFSLFFSEFLILFNIFFHAEEFEAQKRRERVLRKAEEKKVAIVSD